MTIPLYPFYQKQVLAIGLPKFLKKSSQQEGSGLLHPETYFIHVSGDDVLTGKASGNLSNIMGRMGYGKMMAGFVAALTTRIRPRELPC